MLKVLKDKQALVTH